MRALSKLTMRSCEPPNSWLTVVPRAVDGFSVSRWPTADSKCTSPPKAMVTALPLPFQSGLSGECAGNVSWEEGAWTGGLWALEPPPEKKAR